MNGSARLAEALARIDERDPAISAWTHVDATGATQSALSARPDTPLAGLLVGVKDIVDVAGMPCRCGSPIYRDRYPTADASLVARLRQLGATVIGKTATTEFAYLQPAPTRNPLDLARSPGGSSSGSAAAVADGHVDAAIATQTAASITRPASFCGVVGFKPTRGRFSVTGVKVIAPSLDTIGWIGRDVATVRRIYDALMGTAHRAPPPAVPGFCRTASWARAEAEMQDGMMSLARELRLSEVSEPDTDLDRLHAVIMRSEMQRSLAGEHQAHRDLLSPLLLTLLDAPPIDATVYRDAREAARRFDIDRWFGTHDLLVTPAALGEAVPFGSTGDPAFSRFVTLLGLPSVALPFGRGRSGLPLGVQILGRPEEDDRVLAAASWLEAQVNGTGRAARGAGAL